MPSLDQRQSIQQSQQLIISAQMQRALHLLQLPITELSSLIEEELENNPILEYSEPHSSLDGAGQENKSSDEVELYLDEKHLDILRRLDEEWREYFSQTETVRKRSAEEEQFLTHQEAQILESESLFHHLMNQAHALFSDPQELNLAEALIGNFDEFGYLSTSFEELSLLYETDPCRLKDILAKIQEFDPYGIGACSVQESLLIQLRCLGKKESLAYLLIDQAYDDLLHHRLLLLEKKFHCTEEEIQEALKELNRLSLHPGSAYNLSIVPYVMPDAAIKNDDDDLFVEINEETIPPLRFNAYYFKLLNDQGTSKETKEYIQHKIQSGRWLIKSLDQRSHTLFRLTSLLAARQKAFFLDPHGKLLPLTMKAAAEELSLHESTIVRAVSNKYLSSPRGIFPFRFFFTSALQGPKGAISSQTVKELLLEVLKKEDKHHPLSDEEIAKEIQSLGIHCARRTITKYRETLKIGNVFQRKSI